MNKVRKAMIKPSLGFLGLFMALFTFSSVQTYAEGLEELVVTAQKREESLGDVPISITLLTEDQIADSYSQGIEGIGFLLPSLTVRKTNATHNNTIFLRGIGTISFTFASEPSVAYIVDGVVLGRFGQAFADLYEVERIEVLRGPQGTLFGKNASAGVINVVTKKPTEEFNASFKTQFLSEEEYRSTFSISGALTDKLNAGVTVYTGQSKGYLFNRGNNESVNGYDHQGFRGVVIYNSSDSLKLTGILESYSTDDSCCYRVIGRTNAETDLTSANTQRDLNIFFNGQIPGVTAPTTATQTVYDPATVRAFFNDGIREVSSNEVRDTSESTAFSFRVDKTYDEGNIVSITSYRSWDHVEINDEDHLFQTQLLAPGTNRQSIEGPEEWTQFSQEVRWDGFDEDSNTKYTVGAYLWSQNVQYNFTRFQAQCPGTPMAIDPANSGGGAVAASACVFAEVGDTLQRSNEPNVYSLGYRFSPNNGGEVLLAQVIGNQSNTGYVKTTLNNTALFFDLHSQVSEVVGIIAGARFTQDYVSYINKRTSFLGSAPSAGSFPSNESGLRDSINNDNLSAKIGVDFKLDDGHLLYLTYTQGYKGPAFNVYFNQRGTENPGGSQRESIDEETSTNLEFGWKGTFDDAIVSLTYYILDLDGYQTNAFRTVENNPQPIVTLANAGTISSTGIEFDFIAEVDDGVTLNGGLAMGEARHEDFPCPAVSDASTCTNHNGAPLPFAPDLKWNFGVSVNHKTDDGAFIFNTTYSFVDQQVGDLVSGTINTDAISPRLDGRFCADGTATCAAADLRMTTVGGVTVPVQGISTYEIIDSYAIINMSIGYETPDEDFRFTFFVRNLTDEFFFTGTSGSNANAIGVRYQVSRDSYRHYGIELRANF